MDINKIAEKLDLLPSKEEYSLLKNESSLISGKLRDEIKALKINADVFIGGSFAKGTIVKKEEHEIDIFVRFDWRYLELSDDLEKIVKNVSRKLSLPYERIHGSRDYFRIKMGNILFEIIPVLRIKKPREARNVTDLSYFHVNYVKRKINKKLAREIVLAKTFCKARGVYGAESYIQGFSGYGLECLIIYYKSLEKMLKELSKAKERIIIDPEKKYAKKDDVLINLNESKLRSPVVLVDPTWRERNVLAALSNETFDKFRMAAEKFLKNPTIAYFIERRIDIDKIENEAEKKKAEFLHVRIKTNKQPGDIAGTKLKKFYRFMYLELERYFDIMKSEFVYNDKQSADSYMIIKSKKEIIKTGPPIAMKEACIAFKKRNKKVFEKNGVLYSIININYSARRFLNDYVKKYAKKLKEMNITNIEIN